MAVRGIHRDIMVGGVALKKQKRSNDIRLFIERLTSSQSVKTKKANRQNILSVLKEGGTSVLAPHCDWPPDQLWDS